MYMAFFFFKETTQKEIMLRDEQELVGSIHTLVKNLKSANTALVSRLLCPNILLCRTCLWFHSSTSLLQSSVCVLLCFFPSPPKEWADEMSLADIDNMFDDLGELK